MLLGPSLVNRCLRGDGLVVWTEAHQRAPTCLPMPARRGGVKERERRAHRAAATTTAPGPAQSQPEFMSVRPAVGEVSEDYLLRKRRREGVGDAAGDQEQDTPVDPMEESNGTQPPTEEAGAPPPPPPPRE